MDNIRQWRKKVILLTRAFIHLMYDMSLFEITDIRWIEWGDQNFCFRRESFTFRCWEHPKIIQLNSAHYLRMFVCLFVSRENILHTLSKKYPSIIYVGKNKIPIWMWKLFSPWRWQSHSQRMLQLENMNTLGNASAKHTQTPSAINLMVATSSRMMAFGIVYRTYTFG